MKTSLVSREVIADSVELVARGHMFDGLVTISGCDKTIPAMAMVLGRIDIPGLMLYGGSIAAGRCTRKDGPFADRKLTIQDMYEAIGAFHAGRISAEQFKDVEDHACPGAGACGGQFTANTMATACEMLGMSAVGWNDIPATNERKAEAARATGRLAVRPRRRRRDAAHDRHQGSFENAIAGVMATGGSTNAVLHLLAIARNFGVELRLEDFDRVSRVTPVYADLRPWGTYTAPEMYEAGGMAVVGKRLLAAGLLQADDATVTGRKPRRRDRRRGRACRPEGDQPARSAAQAAGRPRHPARQPRARAAASSSCRGRASPIITGRRGCSSARRMPSRPSATAPSNRTTSWCCATRVRAAVPACARCSS